MKLISIWIVHIPATISTPYGNDMTTLWVAQRPPRWSYLIQLNYWKGVPLWRCRNWMWAHHIQTYGRAFQKKCSSEKNEHMITNSLQSERCDAYSSRNINGRYYWMVICRQLGRSFHFLVTICINRVNILTIQSCLSGVAYQRYKPTCICYQSQSRSIVHSTGFLPTFPTILNDVQRES